MTKWTEDQRRFARYIATIGEVWAKRIDEEWGDAEVGQAEEAVLEGMERNAHLFVSEIDIEGVAREIYAALDDGSHPYEEECDVAHFEWEKAARAAIAEIKRQMGGAA